MSFTVYKWILKNEFSIFLEIITPSIIDVNRRTKKQSVFKRSAEMNCSGW